MTCLIVLSHLRWNFVYQRPQHLLSRLSRHYRVVFVEEPVRDAGEPRLERSPRGPNIEVLVPHTPIDAAGFHDDQLPMLTAMLGRFVAQEAIADPLVWLYTPMALPLAASLVPRAVVYDCMDELAAFRFAPRQLRQRESALLKGADVVLTGGPALYESKRHANPRVVCLPSAVDARHFDSERLDDASALAEEARQLQGAIAAPRLGFFGVIDERFDVELLDRVADARPEWQLVMVGPIVKIDPSSLPRRANLHWLGSRSYELLPYLLAGWDVALMPFALNESTRFISPTKTLEYMAGGKPVVSTPVHDVIGLYGACVRIADGAEAFIAACEEALAESTAEGADRRRRTLKVVAASSWDAAAETVRRLIDDTLAQQAPASRFAAIDAPAQLDTAPPKAVPVQPAAIVGEVATLGTPLATGTTAVRRR